MKKTDYELIEQYFNNELSEKQTAEVLKKCADDALFLAAFNRQKLLLEVVDESYETKLRTLLKTKEAEILNQNSIKNSNVAIKKWAYKKWFAIAASLLIIIISAYFLNKNQPTNLTNNEIFAQHFEPYRNFLVPIERNAPNANDWQNAFQYYENQQFTKAINGFDNLLKDSLSADVLFYKGVAELAVAKPQMAIESLEKSIDLQTQFQEEANWYLILAYLKLEKKDIVNSRKQQFLERFPNSNYVEKIRAF